MDLITKKIINLNPKVLFIFGDNAQRRGFGGQAGACRNMPNTHGIVTKYRPSMDEHALWTDEHYKSNCYQIDQDVKRIKRRLKEEDMSLYIIDGIGKGRAMLPYVAPDTYVYLQEKIAILKYTFRTKCVSYLDLKGAKDEN